MKGKVTSVEYNILAQAFANVGQLIRANDYYRESIKACKSDTYYAALATRSYAVFLFFMIQNIEGARTQFQNAIKLMQGNDNVAHNTNGYTYMIWAWHERNIIEQNGMISPVPSAYLFEKACEEFNRIDIPIMRQMALGTLSSVSQDNVSPMQGRQAPQAVGAPAPVSQPVQAGPTVGLNKIQPALSV
jgi:tetratricopeptide (TPR) repeat protein